MAYSWLPLATLHFSAEQRVFGLSSLLAEGSRLGNVGTRTVREKPQSVNPN